MKNKFGLAAAGGAIAVLMSLVFVSGGYSASDPKTLEDLKAESPQFKETAPLRQALQTFQKEQAERAKAALLLAANDEDLGPSNPTLDYNGADMKVVNFTHHDHQKKLGNCSVCHHASKPGQSHSACRKCHDDQAHGNQPKIKDAYHKRCAGCHKETGKGPTACMGCHGRK